MPTTLNDEQMIERVRQLAAEQVGADPAGVTLDTHFFNDLNYDSLDAVDFTMKLEDEFEITIPDEEADRAKTVGQAVELLRGHLS